MIEWFRGGIEHARAAAFLERQREAEARVAALRNRVEDMLAYDEAVRSED